MKLSEAIEQALTTEECNEFGHCVVYGGPTLGSEFLCLVFMDLGLGKFETDVMDMLHSLYPVGERGKLTLSSTLDKLGLVNLDTWSYARIMAYTTQFYCWWVFDLKRKGL